MRRTWSIATATPLRRSIRTIDAKIIGPAGIFTHRRVLQADSNFRATAAVMKMVVNGYAGAGTIELGGYDYHTGDRATGEMRDFKAGQCIGACLEYAARMGHAPDDLRVQRRRRSCPTA